MVRSSRSSRSKSSANGSLGKMRGMLKFMQRTKNEAWAENREFNGIISYELLWYSTHIPGDNPTNPTNPWIKTWLKYFETQISIISDCACCACCACATPHCGFHPPSSGCLCESCRPKGKTEIESKRGWSIHLFHFILFYSMLFHVIPCYSMLFLGKVDSMSITETSIKVAVALRDVANEVYWKRCHPNSDLVKGWYKYVQV